MCIRDRRRLDYSVTTTSKSELCGGRYGSTSLALHSEILMPALASPSQPMLQGPILTCALSGTLSGISYAKHVSHSITGMFDLRHLLMLTLTDCSPRPNYVGIRCLRAYSRHTQRRHQQLLLATHHVIRIHCRAVTSLRHTRWRC